MLNLSYEDRIHNFLIPTILLYGEQDKANLKSAASFSSKYVKRKID